MDWRSGAAQRRNNDDCSLCNHQPVEFFAVLNEVFFETPAVLQHEYPKVYTQMDQFHRQDPLSRGVAWYATLLAGP